MIPEDRLQHLIESKDTLEALRCCNQYSYSESWSIIDGSLVIYDHDNPPSWLEPVLAARDDNGDTGLRLAA